MNLSYKKSLWMIFLAAVLTAVTFNASWAGDIHIADADIENDVSAVTMGVPLIWYNPEFAPNGLGLTGQGQIIGVADTGLDTGDIESLHLDLNDRVIGVRDYSGEGWEDPFGHGTHIATSIVGSGEKSGGRLKGIAYDAKLYFQATYDQASNSLKLPPIYELLADAYKAGVRIHSNSWGIRENGGSYDHNAVSLDKFVWEHPDMVVLKSAGNQGEGQARHVTSPGSAKNLITVGATESPRGIDGHSDNPYQVAAFSSRGTRDARIKPDLVAPGTWILSGVRELNSSGEEVASYAYLSGTSMANALASGGAALTRQYFTDIKGIQPTAALIKAALIHGAQQLPGEPREAQGFGMIDLQATLMALEDELTSYRDRVNMRDNEIYNYSFAATGKAPVRISLVWTDAPGQAGTDSPLVNDLDLKVTAPDGRVFWGNQALGGDRKNNVEVVTINNPQEGVYAIEVNGSRVESEEQPFAIIYGEVPLRGTVRYDQGSQRIERADGGSLKIDSVAAGSLRLINNSDVPNTRAVGLAAGTKVYYLPQGQGRAEPRLDAVYDLGYAALINRLATAEPAAYNDTLNHWAEKVIADMSRRNLVGGFPDGSFQPDQDVTRAQFASMLVRALNLVESPDDAKYYDVPQHAWYRGAVGAAVNAGLVAGYSEHLFGPGDPITREQMAVMLTRAIGAGYIPYSSEDTTLDIYYDRADISPWAKTSVSLMVRYDVIKGRSEHRFAPQGTTTRAEAAAVLQRMLNLL
ncbi:S8 family serine peptidase [Desulfofalx alkaliphila]|uniref:S8 family serine peptidase n=1 Tax=Desulfofalx alkaliphila TaxID=105483 RepID=UPI000691E85A|nr:S8 family serine peptidase [Desulfofalx alkaliphila]